MAKKRASNRQERRLQGQGVLRRAARQGGFGGLIAGDDLRKQRRAARRQRANSLIGGTTRGAASRVALARNIRAIRARAAAPGTGRARLNPANIRTRTARGGVTGQFLGRGGRLRNVSAGSE